MITVAGIDVPRSAMTILALRLHHDGEPPPIAFAIDRVIESGRREMQLSRVETQELLTALEQYPDQRLEELRVHLSVRMLAGG
jgi:hypothetical protein